jgi:hypothetical protein
MFDFSQWLLILATEMAQYYGSEATPSAIQNIWQRYIRPDVRKLNECLAAGGDPKDVALWGGLVGCHNGRPLHFHAVLHIAHFIPFQDASFFGRCQVLIFVTGISKCYGSDCTVSALHNMFFAYVRPSVKVINDTLKAGGDPKTLQLHLNLWGDKKGNGRSIACANSYTLHVFFFLLSLLFCPLVPVLTL